MWRHENGQRHYKGFTAFGGLNLAQVSASYAFQHYPEYMTLSSATTPTCFKSIYDRIVLHSWDIVFFLPWKARRLGNTFKSKLTRLISLPPPLFFCSALWERALCANLTLFPRKIHSWTLLSCLSHYEGESFSLQTWLAASSPNQTTRPRARRMGGEMACICLLRM